MDNNEFYMFCTYLQVQQTRDISIYRRLDVLTVDSMDTTPRSATLPLIKELLLKLRDTEERLDSSQQTYTVKVSKLEEDLQKLNIVKPDLQQEVVHLRIALNNAKKSNKKRCIGITHLERLYKFSFGRYLGLLW